jgi:hypothetical protein
MADREEQRALLAGLEALLQEYEIETQLSEGENLLVLRARFSDLGTAGGAALMEICEYPFTVGEGKAMRLLQFYTTTAENIDETNLEPALIALEPVNMRCPLGAFGIYAPLRQMYHKYTALLGENPAAEARSALLAVVEVLDRFFDETIILADDAANARSE